MLCTAACSMLHRTCIAVCASLSCITPVHFPPHSGHHPVLQGGRRRRVSSRHSKGNKRRYGDMGVLRGDAVLGGSRVGALQRRSLSYRLGPPPGGVAVLSHCHCPLLGRVVVLLRANIRFRGYIVPRARVPM